MIKFLLRYGIPIIGFLVTAAMWAYIWYYVLVVLPGLHKVQFNPVNVQNWQRNHYAAFVMREHHGILIADHNGHEYGYYRDGQWCSLYRSWFNYLRGGRG